MSVSNQAMQDEFQRPNLFKTLRISDWLFAVLLLAGSAFAYHKYSYLMDSYEVAILFGVTLGLIGMGWWWKAVRILMAVVAALSLLAVWLYEPAVEALVAGGMNSRDAVAALANLDDKVNSQFLFKYFLSSTSAIMWMSALFIGATFVYFAHLFTRNVFAGKIASAMTWSATTMGLVGLMVRWRESYLISADIGHIPVSNLYEVFILFAIITALIYLHYEARYKTKGMGGFVLLVISSAIGFLLWYHFDKNAHHIAPLVPALKSYWMKIHVPANFIGYGSFALAAMLGILYLIRNNLEQQDENAFKRSMPWMIVMHAIPAGIIAYVLVYHLSISPLSMTKIVIALISSTFLVLMYHLSVRRELVLSVFPKLDVIDDVMHKSIALGFGFFTIATVLGAAWAAEAWGGYWSWDPKETWALIVWLNYAAWLHMRLMKGWRGVPLAWWAVVGLLVTTFAFLGVNMFLSGLHSYGEL